MICIIYYKVSNKRITIGCHSSSLGFKPTMGALSVIDIASVVLSTDVLLFGISELTYVLVSWFCFDWLMVLACCCAESVHE